MAAAQFMHLELSQDGAVATIGLNRVDTMNALDQALLTELQQAVRTCAADPQLRVLILASRHPKAFVAGADIKSMAAQATLDKIAFAELGHALMTTLEQAPLITVAAVNGFCLGGGFELALACDLIAAGPRAQFGFPEITLGLLPGFGGTQRFTRSVGMHRGLRYILTAERFDAATADALGLLWRRHEHDADFLTKVLEDAADLARLAPLAAAEIKRLVRQATHTDLATGCRLEIASFGGIGASRDAAEGIAAFLGKRKPQFSRQ